MARSWLVLNIWPVLQSSKRSQESFLNDRSASYQACSSTVGLAFGGSPRRLATSPEVVVTASVEVKRHAL